GLLTTKQGVLEDAAAIEGRIREASKLVPLERLAVSPQCGFASGEAGNPLTPAEQQAKLRRVGEVARTVWGPAGGSPLAPRRRSAGGAHGVFEQRQRRPRERPHVALTIGVARLHRDHALDWTGDGDADVAGGVAVAVARRPGRAGLGETPRGAHQF